MHDGLTPDRLTEADRRAVPERWTTGAEAESPRDCVTPPPFLFTGQHGSAALQADALECRRGDRTLFRDIAFALRAGDWLHVIGANGVGKTSLLRTLIGLAPPTRGRVHWNGFNVGDDDFRERVLYLGHASGVKDALSAVENLQVAAALDGRPVSGSAARDALAWLGLRGRVDVPLRLLSQGQRRRALLARLLVSPAQLWVLDEPFAALDAGAVASIGALLRAHLVRGGMAVLTSHQPVPLADGIELVLGRRQ